MKQIWQTILIFLGLTIFSFHIYAAGHESSSWVLLGDKSKVAYVSIKKNSVGEVNYFKGLSGSIAQNGQVNIEIDLSSVETNIGIRNQRMLKHVFANQTKAQLSTALDLAELKAIQVGQTAIFDISGILKFLNQEIEIEVSMVVARLNDHRLMAITDDMIMIKTDELGIDEGVNKLMELAKLPSITRVIPVSLRLIFDATDHHTNAVDVESGKKKALKLQG